MYLMLQGRFSVLEARPLSLVDRIRILKPFFLALSSNVRLRILATLGERGEMPVSDLAHALKVSQPLVSWHLRRLRQGGLIQQRQEGRLAYCSVNYEHIRACEQLFGELLGEVRQTPVQERASHDR